MKRWITYIFLAAVFFGVLGLSTFLTVRFVIRLEPEVTVPDLTGQDTISALKLLSEGRLNLKVQGFEHSDHILKNKILSQDPASGVKIKKGRDVRVVISKGSKAVPMPALVGMPLEQARAILEQAGLPLGLISKVYGGETDRLLAQIPKRGALVDQMSSVDLLVGLGPRPSAMVMPDLTAQNYSQALLNIEKAGLKAAPFRYEFRPNWPAGSVLMQKPVAGSRVIEGESISLTLSRGGSGGDSAEYTLKLLKYQSPYGLFPSQVRFNVRIDGFTFDVHDAWHQPGESVQVIALVYGPYRVWVFNDGEGEEIFE